MDKFCTKCGKPLEEGEVCSCQITDQNMQAGQQPVPPVQQINANGASNYLKNLFLLFKKVIFAPATEGVMFANSQDRNTAFGLMGVQAIFSTLFALIATSKLGSLFSLVSSAKMPYIRIIIVTLIASFAFSCAFAGILLGISILFKNKINYNAALCVAAIRSIAVVPVTIIAIVLFLINPSYGLVLFYMGNLAGLCYMVTSFPITSQENRNKVALIVFISTVLFAIVSTFIMSKCVGFYIPDSVKDSIGGLSNMLSNPSGLFEGITGDMY